MGFLSNAIRDVAQKKYLRQWEDYAFRKKTYEDWIELFNVSRQYDRDFSPKLELLSWVKSTPTEYQDEFLAYFRAKVGEIDF